MMLGESKTKRDKQKHWGLLSRTSAGPFLALSYIRTFEMCGFCSSGYSTIFRGARVTRCRKGQRSLPVSCL